MRSSRVHLVIVGLVLPLVLVAGLVALAARPAPVAAQGSVFLIPAIVDSWQDASPGAGAVECETVVEMYFECDFHTQLSGSGLSAVMDIDFAPLPAGDYEVIGFYINNAGYVTSTNIFYNFTPSDNPSLFSSAFPAQFESVPLAANSALIYNDVAGDAAGFPEAFPWYPGPSDNPTNKFGTFDPGEELNLKITKIQNKSGTHDGSMWGYMFFVAVGSVGTPTPTPPPPTPPPPNEYGWGVQCVFTNTEGISETISANVLDNPSFESGMAGWSVGFWTPGGVLPGGFWSTPSIGSGNAADGSAVLGKYGFDDIEVTSYAYQGVYFSRSGRLVLGASVMSSFAGSEPGSQRDAGMTKDFSPLMNWQETLTAPISDEPAYEWAEYEGQKAIGGGGFKVAIAAFAGEATIYYDKVYAYILVPGASGVWEIACPHEDNEDFEDPGTPTPAPGSTPLPTVLPLPTAGSLPTTEPPIGLTPLPTACFGWNEVAVDFGEEYVIPEVKLCPAPQQLVAEETYFFSGNEAGFNIWDLVVPMFLMGVGAMVVSFVRNR